MGFGCPQRSPLANSLCSFCRFLPHFLFSVFSCSRRSLFSSLMNPDLRSLSSLSICFILLSNRSISAARSRVLLVVGVLLTLWCELGPVLWENFPWCLVSLCLDICFR